MIYTIISLLIAVYALFNYKKALMLFTIYRIFWYSTTIFSIGSFDINTNAILPLWFFILFRFYKDRIKIKKFPFLVPFVMIIVSSLLSCFTAISGFQIEAARFGTRLFSIYIYIWLLWNTIDTKEDFLYLFRGITVTIFVACIYGLIEYFTKTNFVLDYKVILSSNNIVLYDMSGLRGYRITSLFEHPIGSAMTFGLYIAFFLSLILKNDKLVSKTKLGYITMILCIPCVILSKMRAGILFTLIMVILVIISNFKGVSKEKIKKTVITVLILSPLIVLLIYFNAPLFSNMFSINKSSEIGGSSLNMRINQYKAINKIIEKSPVFGLGETFRKTIERTQYTDEALGYEGLIFEQLSMHGYFGLIVHIFIVIYTIVYIPKKYKTKEVRYFFIAYWIVYLASSIPSFRVELLYAFIFYYIKRNKEDNNYKKTYNVSEIKRVLLLCPHFMGYDKMLIDYFKDKYEVNYIDTEYYLKKCRDRYKEQNIIYRVFMKAFKNIRSINREKILEKYSTEIYSKIEKYENYDMIIAINGDGMSDNLYKKITTKYNNCIKVLYLWDDIKLLFKTNHFKYYDQIASFNLDDCMSLNCKYQPVFTKKIEQKNHKKNYDISIIASATEERIRFAKSIYNKYKDRYKFYIYFYDRSNKFDFFCNEKPLSYKEYQKKMDESKAIIECVRHNQKGPTTRVFDAQTTKTKVISTNKNLKKYPIYNTNNFLIINKKLYIPEGFIDGEYLEEENKKIVTVDNWFNNIIMK